MSHSNFPLHLSQTLDPCPKLVGLPILKNFLERTCFGEVRIQYVSGYGSERGLVIEVTCDLFLGELLHHYRQGSWGTRTDSRDDAPDFTELQQILQYLEYSNVNAIDIAEFNLQLKDCLVVIQKSETWSIASHWKGAFDSLHGHFREYSEGGQRVPEEIYLNVFLGTEATASKEDALPSNYWCLYFEGEEKAWIYDLENRSLQPEEINIASPALLFRPTGR